MAFDRFNDKPERRERRFDDRPGRGDKREFARDERRGFGERRGFTTDRPKFGEGRGFGGERSKFGGRRDAGGFDFAKRSGPRAKAVEVVASTIATHLCRLQQCDLMPTCSSISRPPKMSMRRCAK